MLELDQVHIRQGNFSLRANWILPKGQRLAVIGPSGGGKSTLLSVIAGFVQPTSGRILLGGKDATDRAPSQRSVSLLFQEHNLFPHLSVADNVGLGLSPALKLNQADHTKISKVLARVGLQDRGQNKPSELSGGQRQRVALARALLRDKPLLMLDEPFAALGPALKAEMLDLVREIADDTGITVIMVTHDPKDAGRFAEVTSLVSDSVAAAPVETATLLDNPPASLSAYLG